MDFAFELRRVALGGGWPPEQVLHAMPLMLWTYFSGEQVAALSESTPGVKTLLEGFVAKLGPVDSPEGLSEAVGRHYQAHPVDPLLWRALEAVFRTLLLEEAGCEGLSGKLIGSTTPGARFAPRTPPAKGAVRAGPMARFALGA